MEYQCGLCGAKISADMLVYREHTNKHIVELIKVDHPDWADKDGVCKKCVEYYESELKGSVFHDMACVKRQRTIKRIFQKISDLFRVADAGK